MFAHALDALLFITYWTFFTCLYMCRTLYCLLCKDYSHNHYIIFKPHVSIVRIIEECFKSDVDRQWVVSVTSITVANLPYHKLNNTTPHHWYHYYHFYRRTTSSLLPPSPPFMLISHNLGHVEQGDYVAYWSSRWVGHIHQGYDIGHGVVMGLGWSGVGQDRVREAIISREDYSIIVIPIHKCQKAVRPSPSD